VATLILAATIILWAASAYTGDTREAPQGDLLSIYCDGANITVETARVVNITYSWIHSVERSPIIETYIIENGSLVLVEARSQSFGAGHPYSGEEVGGEFLFEDGFLVYKAYYPIGERLEITGHPDFPGNLTIRLTEGTTLTCENFLHAVITIGDPQARP